MNDDEKMFQIGVWSLGVVLLLTVTLQVSFRTQGRQINRVHREIVHTQQQIAVSQANFASYVRPEILRNLVVSLEPKSEVVSFNKAVSVSELPNKESI
ncbi:MAG: hypothetical protein IJY99_02110 [Alphaproteobacteria bacterium]|nr:hypothetical protein [Alphaproteobacteria bacterium]MDW2958729.1 hypothetical protein [Alphaproteobacteria bacterium]